MIFPIANLLIKLFGFDERQARKYASVGLILAAIFAVLIVVLVFEKACNKKDFKIDQDAINKINTANETQRKAELEKVIEQNSTVVQDVSNRTAIADSNVAEHGRLVDEKIKAADTAIQSAKAGGRDVTGPEVECILTGVCK